MKIRTKLILYMITIFIITISIFLFIVSNYLEKSYSFVSLKSFDKAKKSVIKLYQKSENILSVEQKKQFTTDFNNLISEYNQKEILKEEIVKEVLVKIILYFSFFFLISTVLISLLITKLIRPFYKLADKMEQYPFIENEYFSKKTDSSEIVLLNTTFQKMMQKIKDFEAEIKRNEKISGWMEMSRAIVHEMNNFLMPLENNIRRISSRLLVEKQPYIEEIDYLNKSFKQTKNVISNLRGFYKSGERHPEDADLIKELNFLAKGYNIEFFNKTGKSEYQLYFDRLELNNILINLIKNGFEAANNSVNAKVELFLEDEDDQIKIIVKDNGEGLAENEIKEIFAPGYSKKKNGLGFGLSLVKKIVTTNNWKLDVVSEKNVGSSFKLLIPKELANRG